MPAVREVRVDLLRGTYEAMPPAGIASQMDLTRIWGKARPFTTGSAGMHPLLAHSLDVAAVATLLPGAARLGLDGRLLGFLVALHDIGKISRSFQAQMPEHWPGALLGPLPGPLPGFPHDAMGLHLLIGPVEDRLDAVGAPRRAAVPLALGAGDAPPPDRAGEPAAEGEKASRRQDQVAPARRGPHSRCPDLAALVAR